MTSINGASSTSNPRQTTATSTSPASLLTSFTIALPAALLKATSPTRSELLTNLRLLHLLHHRNRNQHHCSVWFRHFGYFRREVTRFCRDLGIVVEKKPVAGSKGDNALEGKDENVANKVASERKHIARESQDAISSGITTQRIKTLKGSATLASRSVASQEAIRCATSRLSYWVTSGQILKWYTAITTLSTNPSFSPLSLTLLAIFSRTMALTGAIAALNQHTAFQEAREDTEYTREVGEVLARFGEEWERESYGYSPFISDDDGKGAQADEGVKVSRVDLRHSASPGDLQLSSLPSSLTSTRQREHKSQTSGLHNKDIEKRTTSIIDAADDEGATFAAFKPPERTPPRNQTNEGVFAPLIEQEVQRKKRKRRTPRNAIDALFAIS